MVSIRQAIVISVLLGPLAASGAESVERLGVFEAAFSASGVCDNPYIELAAEATLTSPRYAQDVALRLTKDTAMK